MPNSIKETDMKKGFDREALARYLGACADDFDISVFDELPSTSTYLREEGARRGRVIIASRQSAGRGRSGKSFFSPQGGLYMSVALEAEPYASNIGALTAGVAVAVCRAIESLCELECKVKWVNDIFVSGRKVSGILCERVGDSVIVGIGINCGEADMPSELEGIAATLCSFGADIGREALAAAVLRELDCLGGDGALDEYRRRSYLTGKRVRVLSLEPYDAVVLGIDGEYRLVVRDTRGEEHILYSGEVSVRAE